VITVAPSADQSVAKTNSCHLLTSGRHCNLVVMLIELSLLCMEMLAAYSCCYVQQCAYKLNLLLLVVLYVYV